MKDELVFVGYTNGSQIFYASDSSSEEGAFYKTSDHGCHIPLYMLKSHIHRIETTSDGRFTFDDVIKAKAK